MFQADNTIVNPLDVFSTVFPALSPLLLFFNFLFFNPVNHFSVYLALKRQALGSEPTDSDTRTVCQSSSSTLSPLFGVLCLIHLTFPAVCYYSFCSCFSPVCICSHRDAGKGKRMFSALHIDDWSWDLNCCSGLIWLNRLHIVQSGFMFEKNVHLLLHIFILLHSTV